MLIVTEERCRCQQAQQASNLQKIRMALEGCDIRSTYSTGFMAAACALPKVERSPSDLPLKLQPARQHSLPTAAMDVKLRSDDRTV